ncbi:3-isopropylmalate dehydratase small subunit [Sphingobium sp.]|uniref:3-isopropylmalate dehydratase small subunit n=1 Tax=Sphingobium sp. TaxID=1912891 RepID=UPI00262B944A|nr:3-isopropylmalate dehydratase small subunit [Sphingobium sp.]
MERFQTIRAVAAPLPIANINTDAILPARYLKTIHRNGLGKFAFETMRYDAQGAERPDFILNRPGYRGAPILIAGANFGCGSSREHAPWALADLGIRCIIAPGFADIFFHNCFKNGILCIALPPAVVERLTLLAEPSEAPAPIFNVDLNMRTITAPDGSSIAFDIDPAKREKLLSGMDDIDNSLRHAEEIFQFKQKINNTKPWNKRLIFI